jgi:hypothetical protein
MAILSGGKPKVGRNGEMASLGPVRRIFEAAWTNAKLDRA